MHVCAFDLSLTRTGVALPDGGTGVLVPPRCADRGMDRLRWIRDGVLARSAGSDLVVLEGYAYGAKGRAVFDLGELGGVVRLALFEAGLQCLDVAPAALKRYATGKGNADKSAVLVEAVRRLGYTGHDNNEADALWLRAMALDHYTGAGPVPARQREGLSAVAWPVVAGASE